MFSKSNMEAVLFENNELVEILPDKTLICDYVYPRYDFGDDYSFANGFYFTLRLRDHYGQLNPTTNPIYYCRYQTCTLTSTPESVPGVISQIYIDDTHPERSHLQLTLLDDNADYNAWRLVYGLEEGVILGEAEKQGNQLIISWPDDWPAPSRSNLNLKLYDAQGQLIDTLARDEIKAPYALVRNINTMQWKVEYVRN